jgi:aminoglycoside phosphotransferase (APT) family kinase protein
MDAAPSGPPGLDLQRLADYLATAGPGIVEPPLSAEVIAGGRSNLTYLVHGGGADGRSASSRAGATVVLRRPPLAHVLPTAHDMAREYRVIAALHPTGFPVPVPLHLCQDPEPIGAPFYLMSYVDGRVLRGSADLDKLPPDTARHAGEILVDTLVALHATDPAEIGLADFGRPDGYLERQVRRWHQQWEASKTRELPSLEECADRLRKEVPTPARATIVHGDYRLDNVMVDHEVRRILAVLDWEMATLGDPLADLGLMVVYTKLAADGLSPTQPVFGPDQGFLTADEMVHRYAASAAASGPVDQIGWYVALGYYKLAIISEGIHARFLMGMTVGEGFDAIGARVPKLIDRALLALDGTL